MKLSEWIKNKETELLHSEGFRVAELYDMNKCKITLYSTATMYELSGDTYINTDIEVYEVNRKELGNKEINGIEIAFNVIKPRCRKPSRKRFCVGIAEINK